MPKFEKGSEAAKEHMRLLRERRLARPPTEAQIIRNNKKNGTKFSSLHSNFSTIQYD